MACVIELPGQLRDWAGGVSEVRIDAQATSVADALEHLWAARPPLRDRVMDELGRIRPHINVFVDGENIRYSGGLSTPVRDGAEIIILPAVSGGGVIGPGSDC